MCGYSTVDILEEHYHKNVFLLGNKAFKPIPLDGKCTCTTNMEYSLTCDNCNYRREAEVCEYLSLEGHPNIAKIFGVQYNKDKSQAVIEMERLHPLVRPGEQTRWQTPDEISWILASHIPLFASCQESSFLYYLERLENHLRRPLTDEEKSRCKEKHEKNWQAMCAADKYLRSLGFSVYDRHENNFMQDDEGTIKMIDFDRVKVL